MSPKLPYGINRTQTAAPICRLFSRALRSQQGNQRMYGRKTNSVSSSCDSLTSLSSEGAERRMPWNLTEHDKLKSNKRSDNLEKELEMLAKELLPRVLRIPFTVEQWVNAINSVCGEGAIESLEDDSEKERIQRRRFPCPERPKLPMIGLTSMEKRLGDPQAKLPPAETPPPPPQREITLRVPDPMNHPIIWVPKLPPQTTKLLQSMPCEIFQDIHRNCKQISYKPPLQRKLRSSRTRSPSKKIITKPEPKPRPKPKLGAGKRRRPCCCCCRMTRQELECAGSDPAMGKVFKSSSKPASAPPPAKPKFKSKPAPKPKAKPKPTAKPAPKASSSDSGPAKATAESQKTAKKEEPPKVEIKAEEPKPAAQPSKTGSESSSEDSSEPNTPPATPAAPAPAAPAPAGRDFMADLFASSPAGGSYAPSGASSPKPAAGGADWMKQLGGTSSPKPPGSPGADWLTGGAAPVAPAAPAAPATGTDWLTGGAAPAAPAAPATGTDWLTGAATPKPTSPAADWLS